MESGGQLTGFVILELVIFFISRQLVLWYQRINEKMNLLEELIDEHKKTFKLQRSRRRGEY